MRHQAQFFDSEYKVQLPLVDVVIDCFDDLVFLGGLNAIAEKITMIRAPFGYPKSMPSPHMRTIC